MDIMNLISQAKKMQEDIQKSKENLQNVIVEGESAAGMVKVLMDGTFLVKKIEISDELLLNNDKKMLTDLIVAACNAAHKNTTDAVAQEMSKFTSMMPNIPGLNL